MNVSTLSRAAQKPAGIAVGSCWSRGQFGDRARVRRASAVTVSFIGSDGLEQTVSVASFLESYTELPASVCEDLAIKAVTA